MNKFKFSDVKIGLFFHLATQAILPAFTHLQMATRKRELSGTVRA